MSSRLPCPVHAPLIPALVDHLVARADVLRHPPRRSDDTWTSTVPSLGWRAWEWDGARLSVPLAPPNRTLRLEVSDGAGSLELEGPSGLAGPPGAPPFTVEAGALALARVRGDGAHLAGRLDAFFERGPALASLPSTPARWRTLGRRLVVPRATVEGIVPGTPVALAHHRFGVVLLGGALRAPLGLVPLDESPTRLTFQLATGHPLPALRDALPLWPDSDPLAATGRDDPYQRTYAAGEAHGLLAAHVGEGGVETCDVGLVLDDLFREVRFGPAGDDPTVEWCVAGSIDHRPGHPGGGGVLFARSIPPRGGAPRRYDVVSFGGTRPGIEQLERRLAALGLHRIDVRMVQR